MSVDLTNMYQALGDKLSTIEDFKTGAIKEGDIVTLRGFLRTYKEGKKFSFLSIRSGYETIQCITSHKIDALVESFVEVTGVVKTAKVVACSISDFEIDLNELKNIGPATLQLPFTLKVASTSLDAPKETNSVDLSTKLDFRTLDFRCEHTQAIFRVIDGIMYQFRTFLRSKGFMEIKSSKLIKSGSEGGANLFKVDYYGKEAFMAQSPQLYKQMAIIGGFKRVYEIGHVYRAEEQNSNRYLSEFTGLDLEMEITENYDQVIEFIYSVFVSIFDLLSEEYSKEIEIIRKFKNFEDLKYNKKPIVIKHSEAIDLLNEAGEKLTYEEDFSRSQEKMLGDIIKTKEGVDFFVVKDYPVSARPFYTYVDRETGQTRSYDFILRGEEILSGAQRVNNYDDLVKAIKSKDIDPECLSSYLEPFKYGVPPHGGCGIGLERLVKSYFGFSDIRYFNLFPRTPERIEP